MALLDPGRPDQGMAALAAAPEAIADSATGKIDMRLPGFSGHHQPGQH
jgi:hypothetical protein